MCDLQLGSVDILAQMSEELDALKAKRRKRRNYGTRTGIVLDDDTPTQIDSDTSILSKCSAIIRR